MADRPHVVFDRLRDERSRRVMLVSHCLLNENTRYAGGAFHPGPVPEVVDELVRSGVGIHQLPCPEQRAWGGVLKPDLVRVFGSKGSVGYAVRGLALRAFVWQTRRVYRRLARRVARDVADYQRAGIEVVGLIGVGASPSCGVATTLDLRRALEVVATCPVASLTRDVMNEEAVLACRTPGEGLFVQEVVAELRRRDLDVPLLEHDLAREMDR